MTELATDTTTEGVTTAVDAGAQDTASQVDESTEGSAQETQEPAKSEEYSSADFAIPEGSTIPQEVMDDFVATAKEVGLTKEGAQKLFEMGQKNSARITAEYQAAWDARRAEWEAAALSDKEYGGEKFNENLAVAKKAYDEFATPELKQLLDTTGLGNHPDMIRAFYKAGLLLSEDKIVSADRAAAQAGNDPRSLYPNSNLK